MEVARPSPPNAAHIPSIGFPVVASHGATYIFVHVIAIRLYRKIGLEVIGASAYGSAGSHAIAHGSFAATA
jgi:hypothetical protein